MPSIRSLEIEHRLFHGCSFCVSARDVRRDLGAVREASAGAVLCRAADTGDPWPLTCIAIGGGRQLSLPEMPEVTVNQQASETFERLLESASDAIIVVDESGVVLRANLHALVLFGVPRQELLGRPIEGLLPTLSMRDLCGPVDPTTEAPRFPTELHGVRRGGTEFTVEVRACPLRSENERFWLVFARDVTDRELAANTASRAGEQRQRRERAAAIGSMAASIAHDLNSWLSVILSCTAFALEGLEPSHPVRADVHEAQEAARHAAALTRRLLTVGRIQAICRTAVDVNETLFSAEKLLRRLLGAGIRLCISANAKGYVFLDPLHLDQVILNLAINARDAMPNGGDLAIETSNVTIDSADAIDDGPPSGTYLRLSVNDTGCGLDPATRAHIFEPFFTTKERGKGTGLGLSTVSEIVAQCGGHISVQSDVGKGARFDIYFPLIEVTASCTTLLEARPSADGTDVSRKRSA
jgi:PAS domain S-box-containing protein